MKKILCCLWALLLCVSLAMPAFGTGFVPSVSRPEKPPVQNVILITPEKPEDPENPEEETRPEHREEVEICVIISTVKEAKEKLTDITQDERDLLVEVYESVVSGIMQLPIPGSYVVSQILDVSWRNSACVENVEHTHQEELEREETVLMAQFDLAVEAGVEVVVMVYHEDQWKPVKSVTNNGDGTVICEFEHIGPVAFCVPGEEPKEETVPTVPVPVQPEPETPDYPLVPLIMLLAAFVLFLLLIYLRRRRKEEEQG